jgi:hypothetical protein
LYFGIHFIYLVLVLFRCAIAPKVLKKRIVDSLIGLSFFSFLAADLIIDNFDMKLSESINLRESSLPHISDISPETNAVFRFTTEYNPVQTFSPPPAPPKGKPAPMDSSIGESVNQGVAEGMSDDIAAIAQKKFPTAYISKNGQEVQKPENWGKRYTPPPAAPADLEKQQRDLTAKYPNIDELVRRAELNRDPDYEMADGEAYYAARDAEQNYQKLRQIQRVIQGLNESLNRSHLP